MSFFYYNYYFLEIFSSILLFIFCLYFYFSMNLEIKFDKIEMKRILFIIEKQNSFKTKGGYQNGRESRHCRIACKSKNH